MSAAPVEVTTRYVTTVDDLPSAWRFVMERLDSVGPDPRVLISPVRIMPVGQMIDTLEGAEESRPVRQFEVLVEGMLHERG